MTFNPQTFIDRQIADTVKRRLKSFPVVALLGARQTGKSTLAKHLLAGHPQGVYLDLERDSDLRKLDQAELFLSGLRNCLVCLDEIQRKPELFPLLRSLVDQQDLGIRFLILGSASPELLRQSSESLAGRICHLELTPFLASETLGPSPPDAAILNALWTRGGFPRSFLADTDEASYEWRQAFIRTFMERDIPQMGYGFPAETLSRFWRMVAHYHGQLFNASRIGESLGVSHTTTRKYLDVFVQTFLIRQLPPLEATLKKRLVKTPKAYVRDSGLLHALLGIENREALFGHPVFGASWEGWCIEQIAAALPRWQPFFYRTSSGEELDLVMERGRKRLAFEMKASLSPQVSRGFAGTLETLKPLRAWIVCPIDGPGYETRHGARVAGMRECLKQLDDFV